MNCDRIARYYRWLEYSAFGRALERRRFAFLDQAADARRILALGEGDGRFLARLVERNRSAAIDYIDVSAKMLALAQGRARNGRVSYRHADALATSLPAAHYDLIVTHFFLDCFDDRSAPALIAKLAKSARPGARWIVSEFRESSAWARAIVRGLYLFFGIAAGLRTRRLVDHRPLLAHHGFILVREETARFGLLASELWSYRRE